MRTHEPDGLFHGEWAHQTVERISRALQTSISLQNGKWLSLEAPIGWGKTRLIQEFYKNLAASQKSPAYWPLSLSSADATTLAQRKRIRPEKQAHTPKSSPGFIWIGIDCTRRNGSSDAALLHDLDQFTARRSDYQDAARDHRSTRDRLIGDVGQQLAERIPAEAASSIFPASTPIGVESLLSGATALIARSVRSIIERRHRVARSDEVSDTNEIIMQSILHISEVAGPDLPVIVAVEDLHLADEAVTSFLSRLMTIHRPVLIVSTAVPELLQKNIHIWPTVEQLWRSSLERIFWSETYEKNQSDEEVFHRLSSSDLARIAAAVAPGASQQTIIAVTKRFRTPLSIHLFFGLPRIRSVLASNQQPSSRDIDHAPQELRELYRAHWLTLDEATRATLSLAVNCIPRTYSERWSSTDSWSVTLLRSAIASMGSYFFPWSDDTSHLETTRLSLIDRLSDSLHSFSEFDLFEIAKEDRDLLSDASIRHFRNTVRDELHERWANLDEIDPHDAYLGLAMREAGHALDPLQFAHYVLVILDALEDFPRELDRREDLASVALASEVIDVENAIHIRSMLGEVFRARGLFAVAKRIWIEVRDAYALLPAADKATVLSYRYNVCLAMIANEEGADSLSELKQILREQRHLLPDLSWEVLMTRISIASALQDAGRPDRAEDDLRELIPQLNKFLGGDNRYALVARHELANALGRQGQYYRSIQVLRALIPDETNSLGADHRETILSRANLLSAYRSAGNLFRAEQEFIRLAPLAAESLGDSSVDLVRLKISHALTLHHLGRDIDAQRLLHSQIGRLEDVVGSNSPIAFDASAHLAEIAIGTDALNAERLARSLHRQALISFGKHAEERERAACILARALVKNGRAAEALLLLKSLIDGYAGASSFAHFVQWQPGILFMNIVAHSSIARSYRDEFLRADECGARSPMMGAPSASLVMDSSTLFSVAVLTHLTLPVPQRPTTFTRMQFGPRRRIARSSEPGRKATRRARRAGA